METKLVRTDFKPIEYDFNGGLDELLNNFLKKVRAKEGVVKYHMNSWTSFPTDLLLAKDIAKDWAKKFTSNPKYNGFIVNIYFHLDKKTIRFQVKKYVQTQINTFVIQEDNVEIGSDNCYNMIIEKLEANLSINTFVFEKIEKFPTLQECKEIGKKFSSNLEQSEKLKGYKAIVFINPSTSSLKITVKN